MLASCRGMLPGSSFLRAHNSGDEIINPDTSVILSGATNGRTAWIGHISLLASPRVYAGVRDFVR